MRMDDKIGTVEVGKIADLVLINGDPLEDIRATQRVDTVFVNGKMYNRAALDTMLENIKAAANP